MPLVRSIDILADGISVVTTRGGTHTITSADIPANVKAQGISACEAAANTFLANRLGPLGMFVAVHIEQVAPLVCAALVSNDPVTGSWWL